MSNAPPAHFSRAFPPKTLLCSETLALTRISINTSQSVRASPPHVNIGLLGLMIRFILRSRFKNKRRSKNFFKNFLSSFMFLSHKALHLVCFLSWNVWSWFFLGFFSSFFVFLCFDLIWFYEFEKMVKDCDDSCERSRSS